MSDDVSYFLTTYTPLELVPQVMLIADHTIAFIRVEDRVRIVADGNPKKRIASSLLSRYLFLVLVVGEETIGESITAQEPSGCALPLLVKVVATNTEASNIHSVPFPLL